MIANIIYSIYFVGINFLIFSKLNKIGRFSVGYLPYVLILGVIIAHIVFINSDYLMSEKDFFNLLFFSVALVILHYATNLQVKLFLKHYATQDERGKSLQGSLLKVFNFMRQKLIYLMISVYQLLAVWNGLYR